MKGISVVEQEQLDNMMIEMDGTENKCKSEIFSCRPVCTSCTTCMLYVKKKKKNLVCFKLP